MLSAVVSSNFATLLDLDFSAQKCIFRLNLNLPSLKLSQIDCFSFFLFFDPTEGQHCKTFPALEHTIDPVRSTVYLFTPIYIL